MRVNCVDLNKSLLISCVSREMLKILAFTYTLVYGILIKTIKDKRDKIKMSSDEIHCHQEFISIIKLPHNNGLFSVFRKNVFLMHQLILLIKTLTNEKRIFLGLLKKLVSPELLNDLVIMCNVHIVYSVPDFKMWRL